MEEPEIAIPPLRPPLHNSSVPRDLEPDSMDLDRLKKWQEERAARKLRGEYESAVHHLGQVINDNLDSRMHVASIRVEGAKHTRKSFLNSLIHPYLAEDRPQTLASTFITAKALGSLLQETGIFDSVVAKLERSRGVFAQPHDVDLVFKTKEKGRFFLNTSTQIGNDEGGASATCRVRNAFGGAETVEASLTFGTKTRVSFNGSLTAPLSRSLRTWGEVSLFGMERDNTSYASHFEGVRGIRAVVRNGNLLRGLHEVGYEAVLRHIANLSPTASISIREAAGQSVKSSLFYVWTRDTRDDRLIGTRGYYLKTVQELAGLGGDASFFKSEAQTQLSRALAPHITISFAARGGLRYPFKEAPTLLPDRFQLGGPTSVRMFRMNGLGPKDGSDSLGGDLYWAAGLSLIADIPKKAHWPVKLHGWVNAGRLDALDKSRTVESIVKTSFTQPSVSAGIGLVYKLDPVRVEVNFGVPLTASKGDGTRKGFQVGIGLDFL